MFDNSSLDLNQDQQQLWCWKLTSEQCCPRVDRCGTAAGSYFWPQLRWRPPERWWTCPAAFYSALLQNPTPEVQRNEQLRRVSRQKLYKHDTKWAPPSCSSPWAEGRGRWRVCWMLPYSSDPNSVPAQWPSLPRCTAGKHTQQTQHLF